MIFTRENTYHRLKINDDILRILKCNRGVWLTASEISERIRGRTDSRAVGQRMKYLADEYPIETSINIHVNPHRKYRYVGAEA